MKGNSGVDFLEKLVKDVYITHTVSSLNHKGTHDLGRATTLRSEGPVDGYSAGRAMRRGEVAGQRYRLALYCVYLLRTAHCYTRRRT